jgi:hypothetical protein
MKKDSMGKYDTLINFSKLAGGKTVFAEGLSTAAQNIQTALTLLHEITSLDMGKEG